MPACLLVGLALILPAGPAHAQLPSILTITAGPAVTEGEGASFTVTATPAPASPLTVTLLVSQTGDFVSSGNLGEKTVTVPTSGSATYTVATLNDGVDEPAGAVTVEVYPEMDYAVDSDMASASVTVNDNDPTRVWVEGRLPVNEGEDAVFVVWAERPPESALKVSLTVTATPPGLVAPDDLGTRFVTIPSVADRLNPVGRPFSVATVAGSLNADGAVTVTVNAGPGYTPRSFEAATASVTVFDALVVSIAAGDAVTEGSDATFTVTASPPPASALTVYLTVSQAGSFVSTGSLGLQTVTVPTSGSATFTVPTVDDSADEANGAVTAKLERDAAYAVHGTDHVASVTVFDDDVAPPPPTPPATPVASITAGAPVTEGGDATFTVTVSPAPASALTVNLTISQAGSFVAAGDLGSKTVTVPTSGSATYTVPTVDDGEDEASGAVTATVAAGTGYSVGTSSSASVTVNDDDAPNRAPTARAGADRTVDAGAAVTLDGSASTDPDGDPLTFAWTQSSGTGVVLSDPGAARASFTAPEAAGALVFGLTVTDPGGLAGSDTVTVTVMAVNASPAVSASCEPCTARPGGEVGLTATASDPDGDELTYAWSAPAGSFSAPTDRAETRWRAPNGTAGVTIRVQVSDGRGGTASASVVVEVTNAPPAFASSEHALELREGLDGSRRPVDLGAVTAEDPDGDELTYELASGDRSRFAVGAGDGAVRYVGPGEDFESGPGRYELAVRARDPYGASAEARVTVTVVDVNEPPVAMDDEAATDEDRAVAVAVLANDADPDGDVLRVESAAGASHGATAVSGDAVVYTPAPDYHGRDRFTYVVSDGRGGTASAAVEVTVSPLNDAPSPVGAIPDQVLDEGGAETTVALAPFFEDADGDALAYRAAVSDPAVAAVAISGAALTLAPVASGSATVTVTAEDPGGLTATQSFAVGVTDLAARAVVSDMLAGMARSHLASARMTLARRGTADRREASRVTVLGRAVPLGREAARTAAEQMLAGWASTAYRQGGLAAAPGVGGAAGGLVGSRAPGLSQTGMPAAHFGPAGAVAPGGPGGRAGLGSLGVFGGGGAGPLAGSEFLLALGDGGNAGGNESGRRWQVWGQGDVQTFQAAPSAGSGHEGELQTGYLGVDTWLSDRWLMGIAAGRSRGHGSWRTGGARGSLSTTLTAVHPYVQWSDGTTSVWVTAGGGRGEVENVRRSGRRGAGELGLALGLVELRRRLGTAPGGIRFGVRADVAWAELWTAAGEETIDGHTAAVNQARAGAEMSRPVRLGRLSLSPFGEAHLRRDRGAGQTGEGMEILAGLRAAAGKVRVVAEGRMLALHSAAGYRERGLGLTLTVGNQDQEGLSLSVSPRLGDAAAGGVLWQDQAYRRYLPEATNDEWALDVRGGYGMRLPSGRRLSWVGALSHSAFGRRFLVGASLGLLD